MKRHSILALVGSKRNTIMNLEKLKTKSLNMHRNFLPSRHIGRAAKLL